MKREHEINGGLPSGYIKLEYIESTGTQYINTGYIAKTDDYKITSALTPTTNAIGQEFFGSEKNSPRHFTICFYSHGTGQWRLYTCNTVGILANSFSANTRYDIEIHSANGICTFVKNGVSSSATTSGPMEKTMPIYLFSDNHETLGATYFAKCRMHGFKITDGGNVEVDMVPALRESDSRPGMYDLARNTFYTNAGTGEFLYK